MRFQVACVAAMLWFGVLFAGEVTHLGRWIASSEKSDALRSVVELIVQDEQLIGRIERVIDASGQEVQAVCRRCPGELNDKPLKGLVFITGLRREGSRWVGGQVINLEPGFLRGVVASCELEIKDGRVEFFGYAGVKAFGKTVVWQPFRERL
jgi:uncharacterized protein (DUF2147 family)